jgi:SAM-dependent methyltransferase
LVECFDKVVATDIEEAFLQNISLHNTEFRGICCIKDDITRTNLLPATFDLILCSETIEHIADVEAALQNIRTLLKKDGVLILSTPHKYCPLEICSKIAYLPGIIDLVRLVYREPILDAGHINLMTGPKLRQLLKKTGFTIQNYETFGCYIPFVAEFLGAVGLSVEQRVERTITGTKLESLLWTQAYILTP